MKNFIKFEDYYKQKINESIITESFKSPILNALANSADKETQKYIKSLYKTDGIALSELTSDDVWEFNAYDVATFNNILKKGNQNIRNYNSKQKRRIIAYNKETNTLLLSITYDPNSKHKITINYCSNSKVKNINQFFKLFHIDYIDDKTTFIGINLLKNKQIISIKGVKNEKEMQHVYQREISGLIDEIDKKNNILDEKIKKKLMQITTGASNIKLWPTGGKISFNNKFHNFQFDVKDKGVQWLNDLSYKSNIDDTYITLAIGGYGTFNPLENADICLLYENFGLFIAAIKDKKMDSIIELMQQKLINEKQGDSFTFEMNGKIYRKSDNGFEEVE